jgi:DNA-binding response OmpR family regulator
MDPVKSLPYLGALLANIMKICLIEDDLQLGNALQSALVNAGQQTLWLRSAADARHWLREETYDAILLDMGLPDDSGLNVLRHFRTSGLRTPLLVISARDGLDDRVEALDAGADDYLVKPFATAELLARLRAVVRRVNGTTAAGEPVWEVRDLTLCESARTLTRAGAPINLSKTEFTLLHTLLRQPDRVFTRRELEAQALPHVEGTVLDVHMYNLRKKLGGDYISTVRGVGYVIRK